jgi:DNA primase
MDALTLLNEHVDILRIMEHYKFDNAQEDGGYVRACCKIHDGSNPTAFVANIDTKLWFCHTGGCGGGDIYTLVQRMEECSFPEAVQFIADFFTVNIAELEIMERKSEQIEELKAWIKAVQSRRKHVFKEFVVACEVKTVTKFRNFIPTTLEHFGLKWVESFEGQKRNGTPYVLKNRLLFPIFQGGLLIGASLRRVREGDFPKWSHQPVHFKTSEVLYNYDAVLGKEEITIVEGIVDVWAYYELGIPAVCTFGAHLTTEQAKLIMRTGADIVLSYDGDEAGREAQKKVYELLSKTTNIKQVHLGEGEDPASIGREELRKYYEQRS